ncbi:MAG TPA: hypothetical protein VNZ67_11580 [bacterium]|jgi:hypothetical protein|nr:hypothetical protein [bacterium]
MTPQQPQRSELHHEALQPREVIRYSVMADGDPHPVETWPRDQDGLGAINATTRAANLSLLHGPHEVYVGERLLARFVDGAREGRTRPLRAPVTIND